MNAILQAPLSRWPRNSAARNLRGMVEHSDTSKAASDIRAAQQQRLTRLRQIMEPVQADAARRAGVSGHAWSRMETGKATVDPVALARWCNAHGIPAEYVITGRLDGLSEAVKRLVIRAELEADQQSTAQAGTSAPASQPPKRSRGRPRRNSGIATA
jgi:transcriptional regulator with XRE-family HTH domain